MCEEDILVRATSDVSPFDALCPVYLTYVLQASTDGTTPVIAIFTSSRYPDQYDSVLKHQTTYDIRPRILTYAIGGSSADRFELRRLACLSGGAYYEHSTNTSISQVSGIPIISSKTYFYFAFKKR